MGTSEQASESLQQDHRVLHPGNARPRLRDDLRFVPQMGAQPYYLVEDPVRSKFYRLGFAEYLFVSLLDGGTTIDEALSRAASLAPMASFTAQDGLSICKWLLDHELADAETAGRRSREDVAAENGWERWNPLMLRLPLLHPDRFFQLLAPVLGWFFTWPIALLYVGLLLAAGFQTVEHWDAFFATSQQIFSTSNWLWLGVSWLVLKVIHEVAHGIACKRYGGVVREAGLLFILFAPLAFVDVTCSWRFRDRWQRILTAAAGMYVETFLAALAVLLWVRTPSGWLGQICFNVATMASLSTILFNANPLMRFDGYYILSDVLGIPNLYTSGQQYVMYLGKRYPLGMSTNLPHWPSGSGLLIRVYGLAAFAWRMLVCIGLVVAASTMFAGAGVIFSALAVALWFCRPLWQFGFFLTGQRPGEAPDTRRFTVVAAAAVGILVFVFAVVPWPGATSAPALVSFEPLSVLRADSSGFVAEIHVSDGQYVEAGASLVVLVNDDLEVERADMALQIAESRLRARQYEKNEELGALEAERSRLRSCEERLVELEEQVAKLTLVAPMAGSVVAPSLETMLGTFVREGDEVLSIGDAQRKELKVSIAQEDVERFQERLREPVRVWLPGSQTISCRLDRIAPRASAEPPDPALCANQGGPLPIEVDEDRANSERDQQYRFLRPRFTGYVSLTAEQSRQLYAGQLAIISFAPLDESIGRRLYRIGSQWLEKRLQR